MCGNLAIPNQFVGKVRGHSMPDSQLLIDSKGQNLNNGGKNKSNEQHKETGNVKDCIGG